MFTNISLRQARLTMYVVFMLLIELTSTAKVKGEHHHIGMLNVRHRLQEEDENTVTSENNELAAFTRDKLVKFPFFTPPTGTKLNQKTVARALQLGMYGNKDYATSVAVLPYLPKHCYGGTSFSPNWVGDGNCNRERQYNNYYCRYDGGDCCQESNPNEFCTTENVQSSQCNCVDPLYAKGKAGEEGKEHINSLLAINNLFASVFIGGHSTSGKLNAVECSSGFTCGGQDAYISVADVVTGEQRAILRFGSDKEDTIVKIFVTLKEEMYVVGNTKGVITRQNEQALLKVLKIEVVGAGMCFGLNWIRLVVQLTQKIKFWIQNSWKRTQLENMEVRLMKKSMMRLLRIHSIKQVESSSISPAPGLGLGEAFAQYCVTENDFSFKIQMRCNAINRNPLAKDMFLMEIDMTNGLVHRAIQFGDIYDEEALAVAPSDNDKVIYVAGTTTDMWGGACYEMVAGDGFECGGSTDLLIIRFERKTYLNGDDYTHPDLCDSKTNPCPVGYGLSTFKDSFTITWMHLMGGSKGEAITALATDFAGYLYATGWTESMEKKICSENSTCNDNDGFILRFNPDSALHKRGVEWVHTFGSKVRNVDVGKKTTTIDIPQDLYIEPKLECKTINEKEKCSVIANADTDIYILVNTDGDMGQCSTSGGIIACGNKDVSLLRWNAAGKLLWKTQAGSKGNDYGTALIQSHFNAALSVGYSEVDAITCDSKTVCNGSSLEKDWEDVDTTIFSFYDVACDQGSRVSEDNRSCDVCPTGTYSPNGASCLQCPYGAHCYNSRIGLGGTTVGGSAVPQISTGFQRTKPILESLDFSKIPNRLCDQTVRQQMPCISLTNVNGTAGDSCAVGYLDGSIYCKICESGFIRFHKMCMSCTDNLPGPLWTSNGLSFGIFIGFCFALFLLTKVYCCIFCYQISIFTLLHKIIFGTFLSAYKRIHVFTVWMYQTCRKILLLLAKICFCCFRRSKIHVAVDTYEESNIKVSGHISPISNVESKEMLIKTKKDSLWRMRAEYKDRDSRGIRQRHMTNKEAFREAMAPGILQRRPELIEDEEQLFRELNAMWRHLTIQEKQSWEEASKQDEIRCWEEYRELKKVNISCGIREARGGRRSLPVKGDEKKMSPEMKQKKHRKTCQDCRRLHPEMGIESEKVARWCYSCASLGHKDAVNCRVLFGEVLKDEVNTTSEYSSSSEYEYDSDHKEDDDTEKDGSVINTIDKNDSIRDAEESKSSKLEERETVPQKNNSLASKLEYIYSAPKYVGMSPEEKALLKTTLKIAKREARLECYDEIIGHTKIIISHIQCLNAMTHVFTIPWTDLIWRFLIFFDFIDLHVSFLNASGCLNNAMDKPLTDLLLYIVVGPLIIILCIRFLIQCIDIKDFFVESIWNRKRQLMEAFSVKDGAADESSKRLNERRKTERRRYLIAYNLSCWVLMLSFIPVTRSIFDLTQCQIHPDGVQWILSINPTIPCTMETMKNVAPECFLCVFLYTLGTPYFVLKTLVWKAEELSMERLWSRYREIRSRFRFLHGEYRAGFYMFEVMEMFRKLIVCVFIQYVLPNSSEQLMVAIVITLLFFGYVGFREPFISPALNCISMFSLSVQCSMYVVAWYLREHPSRTEAQKFVLDGFIILANVGVIGSSVIFASLKHSNINLTISFRNLMSLGGKTFYNLGGGVFSKKPRPISRQNNIATLTPIRSLESLKKTAFKAELTQVKQSIMYEEHRKDSTSGDLAFKKNEALENLKDKVNRGKAEIRRLDEKTNQMHKRAALIWKEIKRLKGEEH